MKVAEPPAVTEAGPERDGVAAEMFSVAGSDVVPAEVSSQRTDALGTQPATVSIRHVALPLPSAVAELPQLEPGREADVSLKRTTCSTPLEPTIHVATAESPAATVAGSTRTDGEVRLGRHSVSIQD